MFTYWKPASFLPLLAMASAVSRISWSLTLQPNLFQLFQPMGGVWASWADGVLLADCASALPHRTRMICATKAIPKCRKIFIGVLVRPPLSQTVRDIKACL